MSHDGIETTRERIPLRRQRFMGLDDQRDLAARGNEDDLGRAARGIRHDIGAARDTGRRGIFATIECRQRLARQREHRRLMAQLQDVAIGFDDLIGVAGRSTTRPGMARSETSCSTG